MPIFDPDQPTGNQMKFPPKTDEQIARENCMPIGDYDFEVVEAVDKISQKGNPMIALQLRVFGPERAMTVRAYLMEAMAFQMRHFCFAVGLGKEYEAGELAAANCIGRTGRLTLKIEDQPGYMPKNAVKDYIVPAAGEAPASPSPRQPMATPAGNDEPPF